MNNKISLNDALKIWDEFFPNQDYVFDFANKLILKNEYNTQTSYSWKIDQYDYNDDEIFIANTSSISQRNKQPVFVIENEKYFILKHPDGSHSIICLDKIKDFQNPVNVDLFINNKLNEIDLNKRNDDFIILIKIIKCKQNIEKWIINLINEFCNYFFKKFYIRVDDKQSALSTNIIIEIDKTSVSLYNFMKIILKINSIMKFIFYRLNKKFDNNSWKHVESNNENNFYNLIINSSNDIDIVDYIFTLDNKILLLDQLKITLEQNEFNDSEFKIFDEINNVKIYEYPYINSEFNQYFKRIKNKDKL